MKTIAVLGLVIAYLTQRCSHFLFMSICPAFPVYLCNKRVAVTCWAMIGLSLSLLKAISTSRLNWQQEKSLLKVYLPCFSFSGHRHPEISAYSIELCNSNCRKVPLIRNRWFKNTLVLHIFVLLIPSLLVMVHDTFLIYLLAAAVLPGRVKSVVVFQKCTSGYMHHENQ